ncbi:MAG TPA: hypothetical protein VGL72_33070 [Bryobacteraceae bacterium]|jgi:hypothetical protein
MSAMVSDPPIHPNRGSSSQLAEVSDPSGFHNPRPWIFPTRGIAVRLFLTCWIVYSVHVATNTVREIFPALAMADHFSFRLDEYAHLHPDLFEKPGYGWHIDANPGVSMIAAVPYFLFRPIVDRVVASVNRSRAASGLKDPPQYNSPWPMAREFYAESWRRGLDIKFGLAAIVMQVFCMAPVSALGVVAMFWILRRLFGSDRTGFWLSLLYAFGTPVFFRAGILNHNMMMGHLTFIGFLIMWNPGSNTRWPQHLRFLAGGLAGGEALLLDPSGVVLLGTLFCYAIARARSLGSTRTVVRSGLWYIVGALPPILFLMFYQWRSFGNPFLPSEHWMPMPPVDAIHGGYRGFTLPQFVLFKMLMVDYRFGLLITCPLFLLAIFSLWCNRRGKRAIPQREFAALLLIPAALVLFFSGLTYIWIQFTYGLRYLAPLLPFLFVPVALVLTRLPRRLAYLISILAVAEAWSMAMYRDVERGFGILDTMLHVFVGGFQLPVLTVFSRLPFGDYASGGVSPLPIFALAAAFLFVIWWRPSFEERAQVLAAGSRLGGRVTPVTGAASGGPCAPPAHKS